MTKEEFDALDVGDVIRRKNDVCGFQVMGTCGLTVFAVRVVTATNPEEWELASKVKQRETR